MSSPVALRIFLGVVDDAQLLRWVAATSPAHVVIRHDADKDDARPHLHMLLYGKGKKPMEYIRKKLKAEFPGLTGNGQYAMKIVDPATEDVYVRYMCHSSGRGDPVVVVALQHAMYTRDMFVTMNLQFWDERAAFNGKSKTATVAEVHRRVVESGMQPTRMNIARVAMDVVVETDRPVVVVYLRGVVNAVLVKLGVVREVRSLQEAIANDPAVQDIGNPVLHTQDTMELLG